MLFNYIALDATNTQRTGQIEATNFDAAISAIQKRGYTVIDLKEIVEKSSFLNFKFPLSSSVKPKEVVILSRQIATLFQAQVPPLRIFRLLANESENPQLAAVLNQMVEELQAGSSISRALASHPQVFSNFYVQMVRSGEKNGTVEKSFDYLADYLDRSYEITVKARNALIYPAFVIGIFFIVMGLMLTLVIPRVAQILIDSGGELPIYTKIVIGLSGFLVSWLWLILILASVGIIFLWQFLKTPGGRRFYDQFMLSIPFAGDLKRKLILTRICDNLSTMLSNGTQIVEALEVTAEVVDNSVYKEILEAVLSDVKAGRSFPDAISEYPELPSIFAQMVRAGDESGQTSVVLSTLALFYRREVNTAIDTLIGMIEPIMIVLLGLGVGTLLASVLMPIYNITAAV
jgi:type II secretory pathway component PulF